MVPNVYIFLRGKENGKETTGYKSLECFFYLKFFKEKNLTNVARSELKFPRSPFTQLYC